MTKIHDLTPEQRRVMLAEAAGWKLNPCTVCGQNGFVAVSPEGESFWDEASCIESAAMIRVCPNYDADLNECHQLEAGLTDEEHDSFRYNLRTIVLGAIGGDWRDDAGRHYVSAKPDQRASALLLTLVEGMEL